MDANEPIKLTKKELAERKEREQFDELRLARKREIMAMEQKARDEENGR